MGNAVLNMSGSGRWTPGAVSERPTNFREKILYLWPNSPAILTMISGKLKSEAVNDPKFTIFEKGLPTMRQPVVTTGTGTSIELATTDDSAPATIFRAGQVIMNESSLELMWVTAVNTSTHTLTVLRGASVGSSTVALVAGDYLLVIGNHNAEGALTPDSLSFNPTTRSNYTQIWRTPLKLTGTAKETYLRTGEIEKELKREAAERHAIEMEWSAIFGVPFEGTSSDSQYDRTTGGFLHFMSEAPSGNIVDFDGAVTRNAWEGFLENLFAVPAGGAEKLCLCGNRALTTLNQMAQAYGQIQLTPGGDAYGLKLMRYETPYGTLQLKGHPLLSQNPSFADWGLVVDTKNFLYRPLKNRDTEYLQNRQENGRDAIVHEFQTEGGWEIRHPSTHGYFKNATTFQP